MTYNFGFSPSGKLFAANLMFFPLLLLSNYNPTHLGLLLHGSFGLHCMALHPRHNQAINRIYWGALATSGGQSVKAWSNQQAKNFV